MRKILLIIMLLVLPFNLYGCDSVSSEIKKGNLEKAYQMAQTEEEKRNIMQLLKKSGDYKTLYNICPVNMREEIKKENEFLLYIKNCQRLKNSLKDDNTDVVSYVKIPENKIKHGITYIVSIALKNPMEGGHFQDTNCFLNSGAGLVCQYTDSELLDLLDVDRDEYYIKNDMVNFFNEINGKRKYNVKYDGRVEPYEDIMDDFRWFQSICNYAMINFGYFQFENAIYLSEDEQNFLHELIKNNNIDKIEKCY